MKHNGKNMGMCCLRISTKIDTRYKLNNLRAMELQIKADLTQTLCVRQMHDLIEIDIREGKKFNCLFINKEQAKQVISKLQECVGETSNENAALPIFDVKRAAFNEAYDKFVECEDDNAYTKWLNKVCG